MKWLKEVAYLLGLPIILLILWTAATASGANFFFPTPAEIVAAFVDTWFSERFFTDVVPSIARLAVGVVLAIVIGVAAGVLIGSVRWLRELTEPVLEFFRALPPPVLIPILMLLIGVTDAMKIIVITFSCVWPVLLNTIEGVRSIDSVQAETSRTYGFPAGAMVWRLVLPSASPRIMAGIRQSLSIGLIMMVISEMFASSSGLGFTIVTFQRTFSIPEMWSGILLLGLIGIALSFIFQWAERRVLRWYHGLREVEHAA
ncbi:MAG TPA: ABC transporter permease [Microbacterium sp.]|nr:ABC transporter permease [Microbacterium sp.]